MTSPYKIRLYEENKEMYKLIARLGNKVAQEKQLKTLCLQLNIYKDENEFNNTIEELIEVKMFRVIENIYNSKTKLLIIENPALGLVYKDLKKNGVNINKATVTANKNRIDKSLYKFNYAIEFAKKHNITDVKTFYEELEKRSSVLYAERRGLDYFNSLTSKNELFISKEDYNRTKTELIKVTQTQKESVPSRKGKTKKFTEMKTADFYLKAGEQLNDDLKKIYTPENSSKVKKKKKNIEEGTSKERVEYENNFNSFLERECILEFVKITDERVSLAYIEKYIHFRLLILDIDEKLNVIKIAEKIVKTYDMLNYLFMNDTYMQSEEYMIQIKKVVKLNVKVVALDEKRAKILDNDCRYVESSNSSPFVQQKVLSLIKHYKLREADIMNKKLITINLTKLNTKIVDTYLNGACNRNIIEKNEKATQKRVLKDTIRDAREEIEHQTQAKLDDETINKIAELLFQKMQEGS